MIGIYKITNPKGKIYIGQSIDIDRRIKEHKNRRDKCSSLLYRSFQKYGIDNHKFEIVTGCQMEELNNLERYYQDVYECLGVGGLNLLLTKSTDRSGKLSEIHKKKISQSNIGRECSYETRAKISAAHKGRKHSDEFKKKISESRKGKALSNETKEKLRILNTGKKMSKESILKRINSMKGHVFSEQVRRNMGNAHIGIRHTDAAKHKISCNSASAIIVINIETGIFYQSISSAAKTINMNGNLLCRKLAGVRPNNTSFKYA